MFRIGGKVKCIRSGNDRILLDKEYTILDFNKKDMTIYIEDNHCKAWWYCSRFSSLKELINETDYLDAFKDNFKDGI